jgi:hypothetical protein
MSELLGFGLAIGFLGGVLFDRYVLAAAARSLRRHGFR